MTETSPEAPEELSILDLTKSSLDIPEGADNFDTQLIMLINAVLTDLTSLGVGPAEGFEITGTTEKWSDFLGVNAKRFNAAKSYMYHRMRLMFDPPEQYFVVTAFKDQIAKDEWKINVVREEIKDAEEAAAALLLEPEEV